MLSCAEVKPMLTQTPPVLTQATWQAAG